MKPNIPLEDLLKKVKANTILAYQKLQTQDLDGLANVASELAMQNFSISWYVAEYEFESKSLEAEYKRQRSVTFMKEREGGATEKNADAKALQKWSDLQKEYLVANKLYRLSKSTHSDIENLIDIMRSKIGILRTERNKQ